MIGAIEIDVQALLKVVVASLSIGLGLTGIFSLGLSALALREEALLNDKRPRSIVLGVVVGACAVACLGGLVLGLVVMIRN